MVADHMFSIVFQWNKAVELKRATKPELDTTA